MTNINKITVLCSFLIAIFFFTGCDNNPPPEYSKYNVETKPIIDSVLNDKGTQVGISGTEFKITGKNFGEKHIKNRIELLDKKYGSYEFYVQDNNIVSWSDKNITIKIPDYIAVNNQYYIVVNSWGDKSKKNESHIVTIISPQKPQLLTINKVASNSNEEIDIIGKGFRGKGKIIFKAPDGSEIPVTAGQTWLDSKVTAIIPDSLVKDTPYEIYIETDSGKNNYPLIYTHLSSNNDQAILSACIEYVDYTENTINNYIGNYAITLECQTAIADPELFYNDLLIDNTVAEKKMYKTDGVCPRKIKVFIDIKKPGYVTISSNQLINKVNLYAAEIYTHMYALFIGISKYMHINSNLVQSSSLIYASDDAKKMHASLVESSEYPIWSKNLTNNSTATLTDYDATKSNIVTKINEMVAKANNEATDNTNSIVLIYFSGHGGSAGESLICPSDYDNTTTQNKINSGITGTELSLMLSPLKKEIRKVLIIDACNSGGFIGKSALSESDKITKALPLIDNLKQIDNLIVGASSTSDKLSYESPNLKASAFTYFILEGLGNNKDSLGTAQNLAPSNNNINIEKLLWYAQYKTWDYWERSYYENTSKKRNQHPQVYVNYELGDLPIKGNWDIPVTTAP